MVKSTALALLTEDDGWDRFDEGDVEPMKHVTSAVNIKSSDARARAAISHKK
jgi:hypothetical protein